MAEFVSERKGGIEVRWHEAPFHTTGNGRQSIDEIVAFFDEGGEFAGGFHMEQMSDDHYWFSLGDEGRFFDLFIEYAHVEGRKARKPVLRLVEQK